MSSTPTIWASTSGAKLEQDRAGEASETHNAEKPVGRWITWQSVRNLCADMTPFEWDILVASTCFKVLLFPS